MRGPHVVHVVEDDDAARDSLRFLLETAGLAVRAYSSAKPFLNALAEVEDGCVITDVRMPDIDGLELVRSLKRRNCALPVIVITGHADVALAVEAMKAGAVDFIEKPYDGELLLAAASGETVALENTHMYGLQLLAGELRETALHGA